MSRVAMLLFWALVFSAGMSVALCFVMGGATAASATPMIILDDFNRGDTAYSSVPSGIGVNWVNSYSKDSWKISSGAVRVSSPASGALAVLYNRALMTGCSEYPGFTSSVDVTAMAGSVWAGLAFNYQNPSNFYLLRIKSGYPSYQMLRVVDGTLGILVSKSDAMATFDVNTAYTLTVTSDNFYDFSFSITESGGSAVLNPVTTVTDSVSAFHGGYAGLYNDSIGTGRVAFDNFRLEAVPEFPDNDYPNDPLVKGEGLAIDSVWSGHPVGFSLLTLADVQIAAYYNQDRQTVLAARNMNSMEWFRLAVRPYSNVKWDSHNSLTLAADEEGYVHLSGNMHASSMNYWRSAAPLTNAVQLLATDFMEKLPQLVDVSDEMTATYPSFWSGPREEFIYSYRNHTGSYTAGNWHLLKYNAGSQTFSQATGTSPLFSWTDNYSVYPAFKVSDGVVHCLYVWRRTTDASSNYRLSYVRSRDMVNWTDAFGRAVTLPVSPSTSQVTIDDVPEKGGLLNGQPRLSLDRDGLPLVTYHKYDESGLSQVYLARPYTDNRWRIVQLTANPDWTWNFSGGGSLPPGGSVGNSFYTDDPLDGLASVYVTMTRSDGTVVPDTGPYLLDESSLNVLPVSTEQSYSSGNSPAGNSATVDSSVLANTYTHNDQSMLVMRSRSVGLPYANLHYYLRWETLPKNRDLPRYEEDGVTEISPPPSILKLYRTQAEMGTPLEDVQSPFYGRMFKPADATLGGDMRRIRDPQRLWGEYLSIPASGSSNFAEWTFTVPDTRSYALGGSTHSLTSSDDSFYIQVDDGPLIDWHVQGRWEYNPATLSSSRGMLRFYLTNGTHTIRLCAREAGAGLEYLWLNEAKRTKLSSLQPLNVQGFTLTADSDAASGYSLSSPVGSSQSANSAHYEIPVVATGTYSLMGRTRAESLTTDSFYLSVNGAPPQRWDIPISTPMWRWAPAVGGSSLNLTAGTILELDVTGRESGSELDSFMLLYNP